MYPIEEQASIFFKEKKMYGDKSLHLEKRNYLIEK